MPEQPTGGEQLQEPTGPKPELRFVLNPAQRARAAQAFEAALAESVLAYEVGQLDLFHNEDETYIRRAVERMLYEPQLPNGGNKERRVIERLKRMLLTEDRDWDGLGRVRYAIAQWSAVIAENPRNAGRYYSRRPLTPKTDVESFKWLTALKDMAHSSKSWDRKWFAQMLLDGLPEPVSNFEMECLFLLRKSDGSVDRLVRLRNELGEVSRGPHHKGSDLLDGKAFAAPEKFREWCLKRGNFAWGGNQKDLQKLHEDNAALSAWRIINQVDSVGWLAVKRPQDQKKTPIPDQGGKLQTGIWFCEECAYADGEVLRPDEDGIYWWKGEGYYLNRMGREANFIQGRPKMRPDFGLRKSKDPVTENGEPIWEIVSGRDWKVEEGAMRELYQELSQKFYDTLGGCEGWLAMGAILSYAAAPEIFARYGLFPGLWIHGQMESGKTLFTEWLVHLWGYQVSAGVGLLSGTTVGLQQQCENYSNQPLWADEYRQGKVKEDKEAILRDSYNRQASVKWTADGILREMRTTFVVSGESTSSDAALRSRFAHVQVSKAKRLKEHLLWMQANKEKFFVFGRFLLERREEFVSLMEKQLATWLRMPELLRTNEREKMVHGIHYSSWIAVSFLLEAHGPEETNAFRVFMVSHTKGSAEDVTSETNINVFLQDLLTAYKAGAVPETCFRLEANHGAHPPGWPNQNTGWKSYRLYIDPDQTISNVNIYLAKEKRQLTLRRKDLQSQLSKTDYWISGKLTKAFGPPREKVAMKCWGFDLDKMEMGRQDCSDQAWNDWLLNSDKDSDPRKGPFFAIVNGLENAQRERDRAES